MSENEFWIRFWTILAVAAVIVIVTFTVCATIAGFDKRDKVAKAILQGADPIGAYCAITGTSEREMALCATPAIRGKEGK